MRYLILLSGMVFTMAAAAAGETYVVSPDGTGDFPTIQAAIDAVVDGDVIELTDGTFTGEGNRDIDFLGKRIVVRSRSGNPEACIINCQGSPAEPHRGFSFRHGEGPESVLAGVTIVNGYRIGGGAISCVGNSCPTIRSTSVSDNAARDYGGGFFCDNSSPLLVDCIVSSNSAGLLGGGILCDMASPTLENCTISHNDAEYCGGGMICCWDSAPVLSNCVFHANTAETAGGALYW